MELPRFSFAAKCLAEAATTMSTAAQAMALAAQAFSSASTELDKLCNSPGKDENLTVSVSYGMQSHTHHSSLNTGLARKRDPLEVAQNQSRAHDEDSDYYLSDDDDKYINALLKRQQSPEVNPETKHGTHGGVVASPHDPMAPTPTQGSPVVFRDSGLLHETPQPMACFERHLLVDLETDVVPTVCALTQRFPKVVCYMQCALPSIMIYHRIIKQITGSTVYAVTRPSMGQSDSMWGPFNRQKRVIILLPETLTLHSPLKAVGDVCIVHVGWPSSTQRYRSQLALHDAPRSVLVACVQDKQIFPSCGELIGETAPWPSEDKRILVDEISRIFPKFEAAILEIPRETKGKFYQDWIEAHTSRGHRYVSSWDPVTLVNRANLYICDVLGYHRSTNDLTMPRFPRVPQAFVSRNGLDSAVDNGVLFVVDRDPGLNHPMDLSPNVSPINKPLSTSVPEGISSTDGRSAENNTVVEPSELLRAKKEEQLGSVATDGGKTTVPGSNVAGSLTNVTPVHSAQDTSNTHQIAPINVDKHELTSKQLATMPREYFIVLEDFNIIPAICMLAKDSSCKNIICYVQVVGVIQTLVTQITALTSKPVFIVASPNSAALPGALKAFDSNTGGIVFCNYLLPLCQALRTKPVHRIIHAGWVGKLNLYSEQINTTTDAQNCIIMTQYQYSSIPDPIVIFGEPGLNLTQNVLEPSIFDTMIAQWENQLNNAPKKILNRCYMEWISYHGRGRYKVEAWSIIELVTKANTFGEKVLGRKGDRGVLEVSEGLVKDLQLQPAVQAGVLRVAK
ncbi:unnamed protein product [Rhizoctonia solani]|uniref:Uncharacterized protein n=1 Tax=Rhizoctonia solani TaxID=456999 RepID=A0A8H3H4E4_9AGAM|nr:unnamed protein product [Rhizoctonia solani]